jgi:GDP-4-dehydro-6-deoxy-D-mannose reductase
LNRCLITGCEGFIGSHMADFMLNKGFDVYGTVYADTKNINHLKGEINTIYCDIRDRDKLDQVVQEVQPDYVFHYAAQSLVIPSWQDTRVTLDTDILGTFHLLDAIRKSGIDPVVIVACSSAEYGLNYENEIPVKETKVFRPSSPYGVSKIGTDMFAYLFWQAYQMKIIRVRPFNITGPRKTFDACSDFAQGIVAIENDKAKTLDVGNTDTIRDVTDIRDGIKAMWLLAEKGTSGEVYNICCNKGYRIKDILNEFISLANKPIVIRQVPEKMRPLDDSIQIGDNSKLRSLGWQPETQLKNTLAVILDYWRNESVAEKS